MKNKICRIIYNSVNVLNYAMCETFLCLWFFPGIYYAFSEMGYLQILGTGDLVIMSDCYVILSFLFVFAFVVPDVFLRGDKNER